MQLFQVLYQEIVHELEQLAPVEHEIDVVRNKIGHEQKDREDYNNLQNQGDHPDTLNFLSENSFNKFFHENRLYSSLPEAG